MDDLRKIDLGNSNDNETRSRLSSKKDTVVSNPMTKKRHIKVPKKPLIIALVVIGLLAAIIFFAIILPAQRVYSSAQVTYAQARIAYDAAKKQNIEVASDELKKTKKDLLQTQKDLLAMGYLKYVPIAGGYYSDAKHLTSAGNYAIDGAIILVDSLKPYAEILGLKGQGSFVMGSAEQRIQTAIMTMGKITPSIDDVSDTFILAKKEIDAVDPNHYPSILG